jgi:hypothetical protein
MPGMLCIAKIAHLVQPQLRVAVQFPAQRHEFFAAGLEGLDEGMGHGREH